MFQGVTAKYPMRRRTKMILRRENQISVWLDMCLTGNLKLKWETVCSKLLITSNKNWRKTIDSGLSLGRITVLFRFISNQCCNLIVGISLFLVTWQWYFSPSPESNLSQDSIHLPKFILWDKVSFVLSLRCKSHQHILWLYALMIHYLLDILYIMLHAYTNACNTNILISNQLLIEVAKFTYEKEKTEGSLYRSKRWYFVMHKAKYHCSCVSGENFTWNQLVSCKQIWQPV